MTHADEARRIVEYVVTSDRGDSREVVERALAAAERRGIERCDKIVQDAIEVLIGHSNIDAGGLLCDVKDAIRALLPECSGISGELPAEPAEPAAKCATCGGTGRVLDKVVASHVSGRGHENSVIYKPCPSCSAKDGGS